MSTYKKLATRAFLIIALVCSAVANAAETVTVDNFARAETDRTLKAYVEQGAFGKFLHFRELTPIDAQTMIRSNRDTLYSWGGVRSGIAPDDK